MKSAKGCPARVRVKAEEYLSRVIGDIGAHQLGNFARGVFKFGKRVTDTFAQNVAEGFFDEQQWNPVS